MSQSYGRDCDKLHRQMELQTRLLAEILAVLESIGSKR